MEKSSFMIDVATVSLKQGLAAFYSIPEIQSCIDKEHIRDTPERIFKTMFEMNAGCWEDPASYLSATFSNPNYDQILYVNDQTFVSNCAHHGLVFFGKVHFGYLPADKIVGLSKIPRMIHAFARRPQVQEQLTQQIVDTFMEKVNPKGCGVVIEAYHLCMMVRGIEQDQAYTKTTALKGCFKENDSTHQEFLQGIRKTTEHIWP